MFTFEIIIVNNDPEHKLLNICKNNYDMYIKEVFETNPGSYAARNKGIKESRGTIIGFTDSDMIPDLNWLETAFKYFSADTKKEIGILTGPVPLFYKNPSNLTPAEVYEKYTGFDFEGYAKEGSCGAGNWFSYKTILDEFGGFRQELKSNGDTELSLKISQKYKVVYIPELINRHPARYKVRDIVYRYRRLLGGTYQRKFENKPIKFLFHIINFSWRRLRFSAKKFISIPLRESFAIFFVCLAINVGAWKEYFCLIRGGETKR